MYKIYMLKTTTCWWKNHRSIKWRNRLCWCIRELNTVNISVLPKWIYWLNTIPIKILATIFVDIDKITLKCVWKGKENSIAKMVLKRKNKAGKVSLPGCKTAYIGTEIKTVWCWQSEKHTDHLNRIEDPETGSHKYVQLIFHKGAKPYSFRETLEVLQV